MEGIFGAAGDVLREVEDYVVVLVASEFEVLVDLEGVGLLAVVVVAH